MNVDDQLSLEAYEPQNDEKDIPSPLPQVEVPQTGRQRAVAAIMEVHPPAIISKLTASSNQSTLRMVKCSRPLHSVL